MAVPFRAAIALASSLSILLAGGAGSVLAREKTRASGVVTACSTYGHFGCYSAPTRQGRWGPQMRLRGGTWIDCEGDCEDTLRRSTIDFWDEMQRKNDN